MAETKTTLRLLGRDVPATEVPIVKRQEMSADFELEDGSFVRFVAPVTAFYRLDGEYDMEGNPLYIVKNGVVVSVLRTKAEMKRK